jgi:hypothetical protein
MFAHCRLAFEGLLGEARTLQPAVWVARLGDISRWWWERSRFTADIAADGDGLCLRFTCSDRATILIRDVATSAPSHAWDGGWRVLEGRTLPVRGGPRPVIGLAPDAPAHVAPFLHEQGYLLDTGETAAACRLYLDGPLLRKLDTEVALCEHIEASAAPLIRIWRWPNEAKAALCVSGDLDAVSLVDYAMRLVMR